MGGLAVDDIEQAKGYADFLSRLGLNEALRVFSLEFEELQRQAAKESSPTVQQQEREEGIKLDVSSPTNATSVGQPTNDNVPTKKDIVEPAASTTDNNSILEADHSVLTVHGDESMLWECEDHDNMAPPYPLGAGLSYEQCSTMKKTGTSVSDFVPCNPYQKEAAATNLPLESFDLRVIYEAGRTGFEEVKDFPIVEGGIIAGRYQVVQFLDSAAFSRAVRCLDLKHQHEVCVKIIRNSKDFFDQATDEIKLLQFINSGGDPDENRVLQLFDYFYYKEHVFIVCELLRDNLYEFGKFNREQETEPYFTLARIQSIGRQVLSALKYIHSLNLLHCDLKPENILIKSYSRCEVKVIDFGSSCFTTDNLSSYIQSRCYRAPEVVLGCHYDGRIDIWSLGAILPELITGKVIFHNDSVPQMLARIGGVCGPFPSRLLHEGRHACRYVTKHGAFFDRSEKHGGNLVFYHPECTPLSEMNLGSTDEHFVDFVKKCLTVDYTLRPTAAELLEHPFMLKDYGPVYSAPPPLKKEAK